MSSPHVFCVVVQANKVATLTSLVVFETSLFTVTAVTTSVLLFPFVVIWMSTQGREQCSLDIVNTNLIDKCYSCATLINACAILVLNSG